MQDLAVMLNGVRQQHRDSLLPRSEISVELESLCDKWKGFRRLAYSYLVRTSKSGHPDVKGTRQ